ncbi:GTPase Era [Flexilinea flocculi]|uniref:GTPase Era n=1 Tax=Flexilinea flocculi TaxID=1678840 RepID=A0A0K8PAC6_9CHLR|nr:GTPase Era [Flexilinea flocculi]GAP39100.1 GTP-binding protein Era [Flexilinea flocculi]
MDEKEFHSGFVSIIGRPNVGKSTLINYLLGQKIAAVSPRPQTTRRLQLGIITTEAYQLIFVDTPGIHKPLSKLGEVMNDSALGTLQDVDCIAWMVDGTMLPTEEDRMIAKQLAKIRNQDQILLLINKCDQISAEKALSVKEKYQELLSIRETFFISSKNGEGCDEMLQSIIRRLPEGPAFYDSDQITDLYEREIASDLIRESLLKNLDDEIPHAIAVRIDDYKDRSEINSYILATLLLEREAHKGIVIGKNGEMIKKIGLDARREIEKMTDRKIYLELRVKVEKNWQNNPQILKILGYSKNE